MSGGRPFAKGNPGGPGRPRGVRNRRKVLADLLARGDEAAIRKTVIDAAKGGDLNAARMVWDRIYPVRTASEEELERQLEAAEARLGEIEAASGSVAPFWSGS